MKKRITAAAVSLGIILILFFAAPFEKRLYSDSRIAMDTVVTISVVSRSQEKAQKAFDTAYAELNRLSGLINFYSDKSEISAINRSAGLKAVKVSPDTLNLIKESIKASDTTQGAFDPTTGVMTILWNFPNKVKPEDKEIRSRLNLVSAKDIVLDEKNGTVFLRKKGMMIDLGGIAKGYAADRTIEILSSLGVKAALVSVAGDIRGYGVKPDGQPWKIGIQDPRPQKPSNNVMAALSLKDRAISTSGDYQRYFEIDGVRYHHILDPKTGMPARGCQSVTVLADRGVTADSLATGVFVLGPRRGLELLKKLRYDGVIVDDNGQVFVTEGLGKDIEIKRINQ
ncbi:MAG: FAD:protein FMN transferase [bacterium]